MAVLDYLVQVYLENTTHLFEHLIEYQIQYEMDLSVLSPFSFVFAHIYCAH